MAKKRPATRPPLPGIDEIVAELEKNYLLHMRWALVDTKDKEVIVDALPKKRYDEMREAIRSVPTRLTSAQRVGINVKRKKAKKQKDD